MKNVLKYKEFLGSVEFSAEDEVFFGRVEGIDDLVTFEATTVEGLKNAFQESVEDYLGLCSLQNKNPHKSYKGSFNVRIKPKTHQKAARIATQIGCSLNQLVEKALDQYLVFEPNRDEL
jgi:predicted HicB family RNase H-like nuclease